MKQILNSIMLFLLLFIGQSTWGQNATVVASGTLDGTNIQWSLSSTDNSQTYTLTITGSGDIPDYTNAGAPWVKAVGASENAKINMIDIDSRITRIGNRAFMGVNITSFSIPTSCTSIGVKAFSFCSNLKEVFIPTSVTTIDTSAFQKCDNLSLVHYDGRCTNDNKLYYINLAETGKIIEKEGTGKTNFVLPSKWEYYTHGEKCQGGAWVAENSDQTKLFFYAQNPGAKVNYAWSEPVNSASQGWSQFHPWRTNCYKYTSLEINKNVSAIDDYELCGYSNSDISKMGYTSMQTISVESGNANFVVGDDGALYDNAKTSLYLYPATSTANRFSVPSSVTEIKPGAFCGASNLKSVTFLGTINKIGAFSFVGASSLNYIYFATKTAPSTYPTSNVFTGVASEGLVAANADTDAFRTFTNTVGANWTFDGSTTGSARGIISDGTLYIKGYGEYTSTKYSYRSNFSKIVVEDDITNIGDNVFSHCSNVTEVTLNNNGIIGYLAFEGCTALTRVNVGSGVTEFEYKNGTTYNNSTYTYTYTSYNPFKDCSNLSIINTTDFVKFNAIKNLNLLTNSGSSSKNLLINGVAHSSTSAFDLKGVTEIQNASIRSFSNVTKIIIPSTVTAITNSNFEDCKYLTEITVPATVTSVGERAFWGCTGLKTATLNNNGSIGHEAFRGCTALTNVTLNNKGVIGYSAFENCTALTRINIGSGVTGFVCKEEDVYSDGSSTVYWPFKGCSNLSIVNTTDFVKFNAIEHLNLLTNSVFGSCEQKILLINGVANSYTGVFDPKEVTEINHDAIAYFENITKIKIPSTVTAITNSNFWGCKYLTEITVPVTVTSVGERAFWGCTGLKTATLNNNGSIGNNAFRGCTALTNVTLNNKGIIGYSAFENCGALTRVNIGSGVTAFEYKQKDVYSDGSFTVYWPFTGCSNLSIINATDFASFNAIENLDLLTWSLFGTCGQKTLLINGTTHNADNYFYIPEGVTSYNKYALRYFSNVKKVCLPSTMTTVSGFNDHSYLTNVTLPSSVTSVASGAFSGCSALEHIACLATTVPSATAAIASNPSTITLKVPSGSVSNYKAANYWKEFNVEGGKQYVYDIDIDALESVKLSNRHSILTTQDALSWKSSNTDRATVNNGVVTGVNFVYDGSTLQPSKYASITADLVDGDSYFCGVHVTPKEVALTDGNAYKCAVDLEAEKVSYTRTYKSTVVGKWQAFYVPFDIEITEELLQDYDFAKLYVVCYQDANNNDVIDATDPLKMIFNKLSVGKTLHANMPYYVRVKSAGTKTITVNNTELKAAANGSVNCSTTEHEYSLVGVYEKTNLNGLYAMTTSGNFSHYTKEIYLGSFRWYMEIKSRTGSGTEFENYAHPIEIVIDGEDETTGIVALEGKASAPQNDKIFTLDGRQVTDYDNLPSGIYIINGKKVFKK